MAKRSFWTWTWTHVTQKHINAWEDNQKFVRNRKQNTGTKICSCMFGVGHWVQFQILNMYLILIHGGWVDKSAFSIL